MPSFWETIKVDGQDMRVYVSVPSGSGPFPAVVVSQHGGGVDQFIRDMSDRLAGEGYAAAAPELYHRITDDMLAECMGVNVARWLPPRPNPPPQGGRESNSDPFLCGAVLSPGHLLSHFSLVSACSGHPTEATSPTHA